MTTTMIKLLGRRLARELDRKRWICEMRILRSIQARHAHWICILFSHDLIAWSKIDKVVWYYDTSAKRTIYKPRS